MSLLFNVIFISIALCEAFGKTCPGFPGYCSESFPGQTCVVVCSRGRNNVPLCQEDGTWTDIPRCIEHEPGVVQQIPGLCPGISGYCSDGFLGQKCQFKCSYGGDIDSTCTADGTWNPYPRCLGDIRESQDGCNPCPGPLGERRNRTLEAIYRLNDEARAQSSFLERREDRRIPVPTFSGNQRIGPLANKEQGTLFRSNPRDVPPPPPPTLEPTSITPSPTTFRVFSSPSEVPPTQVEDSPSSFFHGLPPHLPEASSSSSSPPKQVSNPSPSVKPIFQSLQKSFSSRDVQKTRFVFKNGRVVPVIDEATPETPTPTIDAPGSIIGRPPPLFREVLSKPRSNQQFGSFGPFQIFDPNAQRTSEPTVHQAVPPRPPVPGSDFGPFQTLLL